MWDSDLYKSCNEIGNPLTSNSYNEPVWLQDTPHLEILELSSDDDEKSFTLKDHEKNAFSNQLKRETTQGWYKIYEEDKQPMQSLNGEYPKAHHSSEVSDNNMVNDFIHNSYGDKNYLKQFNKNNNFNFYAIASNKFDSSDSSWSDEKLVSKDIHEGQVSWMKDDSGKNCEMLSFDEVTNKHTVWIYSFQNKHMDTDDTSELFNVPSQDTSSSATCSLENTMQDQPDTNDESSHRVSSPIPSADVPRLDLIISTLPTITEITEPEDKLNCKLEKPSLCNKHSWFDKKAYRPVGVESIAEKCNNSNLNIVNWMCLSPRVKQTSEQFLPSMRFNTSITNKETKKNAKINIAETEETVGMKKILIKIYEPINNTNDDEYTTHRLDKLILNKNIRNEKQLKPVKVLITDGWLLTNEVGSVKSSEKKCSINVSERDSHFDISTANIRDTQGDNTLNDYYTSTSRVISSFENSGVTHTIPSLHLSIESELEERSCLNRLAECFKCCL